MKSSSVRSPAPPVPSWLAPLLPFERSVVEVVGHGLHLMEAGSGSKAVVMLHGNPTWGFLWRKVAAVLAGEPLRRVIPDLVGLGLSDKPRDPGEHTLENHARWIGGLLAALGLDRLVFVGQDWGGPIGLRALADRPKRVAGLVILNTLVGPPRPGFRPTAFHRFARMPLVSDVAFRVLSFPQSMLWTAQGDRSRIRGIVSRAYRWPLRNWAENGAPLALARMVPDHLAHPSIAGLERCQRFVETFEGPSAIVWGDRDPVLGRAFSRVQKVMPRAEVTRTAAGHFLQEEVPTEIAAAIVKVARQASP